MLHRNEQLVGEITKKLMDEGRIIEAGWVALKMMAVNADAPDTQIREMRKAFFIGAQHLFSSLMMGLDPGGGVTKDDLKRFNSIDLELRQFLEEIGRK